MFEFYSDITDLASVQVKPPKSMSPNFLTLKKCLKFEFMPYIDGICFKGKIMLALLGIFQRHDISLHFFFLY